MLRRLLVGIDGSPGGHAALELAIRWARRFDALIMGLGIIDEPGLHGPEEMLIGQAYFERLNQGLLEETRQTVDAWLEAAAGRCSAEGVAFRAIEDVGTPHLQVLKEAQRCDLILLGRQTHFRLGWQAVSDDTLPRVLAASPRPVVAVPGNLPGPAWTVLVGYDGSLQAARTLALFVASGLGRDHHLDILCASDDGEHGAAVLDRAADFAGAHDLRVTTHNLANFESPGEAILDMARQLGSGLVVMGAHGRSTLHEFFLGSVTRQVLRSTTIPVFLSH